MATWKKITLWIAGLLVATFAGCAALLDHFLGGLCATSIVDQVVSPDGQRKAVLFQIDCGATSDFNSQVVIVPRLLDVYRDDALPKSFFAADRNHGQAPSGAGGGPEVRIRWLGDDHLRIEYHAFARVIRAENAFEGVPIDYRTFR